MTRRASRRRPLESRDAAIQAVGIPPLPSKSLNLHTTCWQLAVGRIARVAEKPLRARHCGNTVQFRGLRSRSAAGDDHVRGERTADVGAASWIWVLSRAVGSVHADYPAASRRPIRVSASAWSDVAARWSYRWPRMVAARAGLTHSLREIRSGPFSDATTGPEGCSLARAGASRDHRAISGRTDRVRRILAGRDGGERGGIPD